MLKIGDMAPDFEADTTEGHIKFHEWLGSSWGVLFSHPKDFTPIWTTELGYMAKIKPEFDKRGVKIVGLSVDPVTSHSKWAADIKETQGYAPNYPMIGDPELKVAKSWGMLPADLAGSSEGRTPADNQTVRNVFVIGPDKKVKLILVYPMTTGRNFDEVLRVIDSLQLTAKHKVATPVNWKSGEDVVIVTRSPTTTPGSSIRTAGSLPSRTSGSCLSLAADATLRPMQNARAQPARFFWWRGADRKETYSTRKLFVETGPPSTVISTV
jgi:alkyl hydroperoxide reductase subunit AhpC